VVIVLGASKRIAVCSQKLRGKKYESLNEMPGFLILRMGRFFCRSQNLFAQLVLSSRAKASTACIFTILCAWSTV
jgi:hypothetical protein